MTASRSQRVATGQVLGGRYELMDVLGSGATGIVCLARDRQHDEEGSARRVAVKVIHEALLGHRQISGRFQREAAILKRVAGAHVARLLDFFEDDGLWVMVLEHVDGPSLEEVLRCRRPLGVDEAVCVGTQICWALESIHKTRIIHRDLKPGNVLLAGARHDGALDARSGPCEQRGPLASKTVVAKVVDFGLAKMLHGEQTGTALTERDMVFGTPEYMAPEQVRGDELDPRCDVYAAGVMLYEMLSGDVPFSAPTPLGVMTAQLHHPTPRLERDPAFGVLPEAIRTIVLRALAKDRQQRFESAGALADALLAAVGTDDTTIPELSESGQINTTLPSLRNTTLEADCARQPRVRVIVRDADPPRGPRPEDAISDRVDAGAPKEGPRDPEPRLLSAEGLGERRLWLVLALVAALAAVGLGVYFGVG